MPKLSEQEFIKKVANIPLKVLLNTNLGNIFRPFSERCQELEFEITIDHKLGVDFSAEKRQRMREIFCSFNKSKNSLLKKYKQGFLSGELFAQKMQEMLDDLIAAYSKVLSAEELKAFLDVEPNAKASLPFNPTQLP